MKVILLTAERFEAYEKYVSTHQAGMLYYSLKFRDFLQRQTGSASQYYIALDKDEQVRGILPLMMKNGPLGMVINSLPYYGSNGGILADSPEAKKALLEKYIEIVKGENCAAATLIENPLDKDYPYEQIQHDELDFRIGQISNISGSFKDLEDIMIRFHSKTRNLIRKAIKSNIIIEIDNDQFEFLEKTHNDNMNSIGGLAKGADFFQNVQSIFKAGTDYNLYTAKMNGELIAATLVFYYGSVVEYYTPVIVKEFRSFQPLSLIIASAMLEASTRGYKWWNWGGTWQSQDGVYDFKSKWGTVDINYNYYVTVNNKDIYNASKKDLLEHYSGVYVVPFNKINEPK